MPNQLTEMTSYNIVTADFPYLEDASHSKKRPALVLTKPHGPYDLVVLAYITTTIDKLEPPDIFLEQGKSYFSRTGLQRSSLIQLHKLFTLSLNQLHKNLGSLSPSKSKEVQEKLRALFDIA